MRKILCAAVAAAATAAVADDFGPRPTPEQRAWQEMELTMFLHFGMNTFTDREWGDGQENPAQFNPSDLDAAQWVRTAKAAGFKLMILTAKHHDGFCLWPSKLTAHDVAASPWRGGSGDVVRAFVDACRAADMKIGLYVSPWDRHEPTYGRDAYNDHFAGQLEELLTAYGPVDEMWFDGACGEGPNGKKQVYDWPRYFAAIRRHCPKALVAIMGPDIRWVGNESGVARPGESSVQDPRAGVHGARAGKVWYPAECDVSIRPGWFYHAGEDAKVKSLDHLMDIYFKSVGRNSVLLLNVPPDRRGRIADADVKRLAEFRAAIDGLYAKPALPPAAKTWAEADGLTNLVLEAALPAEAEFNLIDLAEDIAFGERVARYRVEARSGGVWRPVARGTVIGQRNLHLVPAGRADRLRLTIEAAHAAPRLRRFAAYRAGREAPAGSASLAVGRPATASDVHGRNTNFGADKAVDGDLDTRWATGDDARAAWLEVDLLQPATIGRFRIHQLEPRVTRLALLVRDDPAQPWRTAWSGAAPKQNRVEASFPPVTARFVRLDLSEAWRPSIWEFELLAPGRSE